VLFVLVAYRLIVPGSERFLHRAWFGKSALADLLGADFGLAEAHKLHACHDRLLAHKEALFGHLTARWRDLFNVSFDVLRYDLTSTYFESDPPHDEAEKRRKRSDCVQVVIALVVTPDGLLLAYEVLAGADNSRVISTTSRTRRVSVQFRALMSSVSRCPSLPSEPSGSCDCWTGTESARPAHWNV
jgi:hypothetical protein